MRDLLGGLWSTVAVQAPCAAERLAILRQGYPQLAALLPAGLMALSLVKLAAGQPWEAEEVCTSAPEQGNCRALLSMQARCCCVSAGVLLMDHTVAKVGAVLWRLAGAAEAELFKLCRLISTAQPLPLPHCDSSGAHRRSLHSSSNLAISNHTLQQLNCLCCR